MAHTRLAVLAALVLSGCTGTRSYVAPVAPSQVAAAPVQDSAGKRICVVRNPRVMGYQFLEQYLAALEKRGYLATVVDKNPQPSECPLTSRYTAFNQLFRVEVYSDGKPIGAGTLSGYYSEGDITSLVNRLLP